MQVRIQGNIGMEKGVPARSTEYVTNLPCYWRRFCRLINCLKPGTILAIGRKNMPFVQVKERLQTGRRVDEEGGREKAKGAWQQASVRRVNRN